MSVSEEYDLSGHHAILQQTESMPNGYDLGRDRFYASALGLSGRGLQADGRFFGASGSNYTVSNEDIQYITYAQNLTHFMNCRSFALLN